MWFDTVHNVVLTLYCYYRTVKMVPYLTVLKGKCLTMVLVSVHIQLWYSSVQVVVLVSPYFGVKWGT